MPLPSPPHLVAFGLVAADAELALNLFGNAISAVRDVARERGGSVREDVDRRRRRSAVDENGRLVFGGVPVGRLEHVLDGERVEVHDHRTKSSFHR